MRMLGGDLCHHKFVIHKYKSYPMWSLTRRMNENALIWAGCSGHVVTIEKKNTDNNGD